MANVETNVEIYAKDWCPYCKAARQLLTRLGVDHVHHDVTHDGRLEQEMRQRSGRTSVPQIFVDGANVGGFDDLVAAQRSGELDALLATDPTSRIAALA